MERKTYYYILAFGLSALFLYTLISAFFLRHMGISTHPYLVGRVKDIFAIFIIVYESFHAKRLYQRINWVLFPLVGFGYVFSIMHWPGGLLLFLGSLLTILIVLFLNAITNKTDRSVHLVLLIFPLIHFIFIATKIFHLPQFMWTFDLITIGLTAIFVSVRLAKRKQDAH